MAAAKLETNGNDAIIDETSSDSSAGDDAVGTPLASREGSDMDLTGLLNGDDDNQQPKRKSLKDRAKIPLTFYVVLANVAALQYTAGIWRLESLNDWTNSMITAGYSARDALVYLRDMMEAVYRGKVDDWKEVGFVSVVTFMIACTLYVLIVAPFRAGFWTGPRTSKHKIHRYMGMAYLIQYFAAWIEFYRYSNNYDVKDSVLPHFIAINGLIQGWSAFFSFKVLPDLDDPGYYSDQAVASRTFVHENIFFTLLATWGSVYYNETWRDNIQSTVFGQIMEAVWVFFPYVLVRPFFPTTSFSSAGSGRRSRSERNETFYRYGTLAVKFFYLWAKYFLGFMVNSLWLLKAATPEQSKFLKGMFLLNLGTVSIAIFLHTLRFKKVLPAKLTFSIYLLQIYATFSAIPLAFDLFASHKAMCGMQLLGILANMTRKRWVHAAWCCLMLYLVKFRQDLEW
ncbi:hypothetical protein IV203_013464 [Nitzschia inconspicua]|uniref:Uncharacterized protein n=1 Tax=Nitzschia inconspicua TaxID=303405 RepID=A0A9K3QA62_9STRA|nr:hypothetical protein IV203_013464 [Nitzschia inconspicua]